MKVDENIFFREATLRICSTLELNKALKKTLLYLRKFMPAGSIALYFYHYDTVILEAIAGAIHSLSARKNGPLIKVNCGAIPETVMDSELFGHERGGLYRSRCQKKGAFRKGKRGHDFSG